MSRGGSPPEATSRDTSLGDARGPEGILGDAPRREGTPRDTVVVAPGSGRGGSVGAASVLGRVVPAAVIVLALLVVWQVAVTVLGTQPQVLPSPLRVLEQGWAFRDALWTNTVPTVQVTAVGFAVSLAVAWTLAVVVDFSPWLRRALVPLLVASQTLPIIAIAPLLIIWFGFGLLPKVLVIALVTFFPIAVGLIEGFAATDRDATSLLRSMGASRWQQFRYVRLPGAMPSFFTALRIGITYAVTGAIFAEYVGARSGLGIFMQLQKNSFRTDLVLAAVLVTALLSVALFGLTYLVQRVLVPWYRPDRGTS
ncbi:ABC-type nitrate/sulfonate/bicarbonate transport system permease component [Pseudonocardia sediminis]|uniref:ABC-type nitrate/sulfonate/bicarbonate transport system permease component n=1 Tax=Pseudonocardia sediminis TaxID=1397368 RepID=A0A4Q7UUF4_PSEST|nr:ABC-type nitrate/sulfonate/bicarbonate transport system permease component [Pseudonocardia sediminis]